MAMQNVVIRVSPEILSGQARQVLARIRSIENRFERIETAADRSDGYWSGEAGDTHRRVFRGYREEIEQTLERFRAAAESLEQTAKNYTAAEAAAESESEGLPADVIV